MLPNIPNRSAAARVPITGFGGLDRRAAAANGAIIDTENLTAADVPVLSSRRKRKTAAALSNPRGIFAVGTKLFYVDANTMYKDGTAYAGTMPAGADAERIFAALGTRLVVWPDKRIYDTEGTTQDQLAKSRNSLCVFEDGTYAGEPAEGNTIRDTATGSFVWTDLFKVGDAVTITCNTMPQNNKTAIIREINGKELRFYENTFETDSSSRQVTVARTVPDLDYICVNENRVWGCKGDTIRCCKLGDPTNWNVFDGLSTDAWSVETGTPGNFTGCISFMGYPIFFKEDRVFKVYGNRPSNFELMSSATLGVVDGRSMAVAGETLFYLSRAGFVRYNGGYPSAVDAPLNANYSAGAAGSDGKRYYVSALRSDSVREFLVYDPEMGLWIKEDNLSAKGFANVGNVLYAQTAAANVVVAGASAPDEAAFDSGATFADFDLQTFGSKYPVRLWLRYECDPLYATIDGATTDTAALTVTISYNGGTFETVVTLPSGQKHTMYVPVPIRRCDSFRVKIRSNSAFKLYAMEIETRAERTNRKGG